MLLLLFFAVLLLLLFSLLLLVCVVVVVDVATDVAAVADFCRCVTGPIVAVVIGVIVAVL